MHTPKFAEDTVYNKIIRYIKQRHRIPLVCILCLLAVYASAQTLLSSQLDFSIGLIAQTPQNPQKPQTPQNPQGTKADNKGEPKLIRIIYAGEYIKEENSDNQVLVDSVIFLHEGAYLYCDSAYFNKKLNSFDAFSNVRMEQGDTLFLYGNYMHYDGNLKLAQVRENVRLEHRSSTLFTDSLDYDRMMNIGYYFDGGVLIDEANNNELTSFWGQYEPNSRMATFKDSVQLINPKFILYSDLLKYNTHTKLAYITTPTTIVSDSGTIYTSKGVYNTDTDESVLLDQSTIVNKEGNRFLRGDSIFYNKTLGYGEVFGNMFLQDTIKKAILIGNYGFYDDKIDFAMATDSAYCIEYSQGDSLFLHADTLMIKTDSIYRDIRAYYGVRFYRSDIQGVCDSMQFHSRDSVLHLYKDPILWNKGNQLYGDTIDIFMNDSTVDYVHVKRYSFSIEQKDSIHFNQMKGRSLKAFMDNGKLRRVLVEGNAESIFYPQESDGYIIMHNWLQSGYMEIFFNEGKLDKMKGWPQPIGKATPLELLPVDKRRLEDFYWYDYLRPINKDDIFRNVKKKATDIKPPRPAIFERADDEFN